MIKNWADGKRNESPTPNFSVRGNKFRRWNSMPPFALIARMKTRCLKDFFGMKLLDVRHVAFIVIIFSLLTGCTSSSGARARIPKPKVKETDPINQLVAKLSLSNGYWAYGIFTPVDLPASASAAEVISEYCDSAYDESSHQIIKIRLVCIGISIPADYYTAVLMSTVYGTKIVLLQYQESNAGWWCREYDAYPSATSSP